MMTRKIVVDNYNPHWSETFQQEQVALEQAFANLRVAIHHIGSTAVHGLSAKPIIDILVEVDCLSWFEDKHAELSFLGYIAKGENGIVGRQYFQKGGIKRSHHLHGFKRHDIHALRHLAFRDYLRSNPDVSKEYGELKCRVAQRCLNDMNVYTQGKESFIQYHLTLAMKVHANHLRG
jgi:GrpB-like predicted nucleotidyltransferase (UPF0157 family)